MLDGGIIQRLLEEKWKTFARVRDSNVVWKIAKKINSFIFFVIRKSVTEAVS